MKTVGKVLVKILAYLADRIFSAIVMGVALAVVLMELSRRGYLNIGG
jgi:hypothetical protein